MTMALPAPQIKHASRLREYIAAGWPAIPILPPHRKEKGAGKRPGLPVPHADPAFAELFDTQYLFEDWGSWPTRGYSEEELTLCEAEGCGTGIVGMQGHGALDFDLDLDPSDWALAGELRVWLMTRPEIGPGMVWRIGKPPRLALPLRITDGTLASTSTALTKGKFETIGTGKQYVIDGIHPSGKVYELHGLQRGQAVPDLALPQFNLTMAQATRLIDDVVAWFDAKGLVPAGTARPVAASTGTGSRRAWFPYDSSDPDLLDALVDALANDYDYHGWIEIGQAIAGAYGQLHRERGWAAWTKFSEKFPQPTPGIVEEKWKSFDNPHLGFEYLWDQLKTQIETGRATGYPKHPTQQRPLSIDDLRAGCGPYVAWEAQQTFARHPAPVQAYLEPATPLTGAGFLTYDIETPDADDGPIIYHDDKQYLMEGEIALLVSPPGTGKSLVSMNYLMAGLCEETFYGTWRDTVRRVGFIAAEENRKMMRARVMGWDKYWHPFLWKKPGAPHRKLLADRAHFFTRGQDGFDQFKLATSAGAPNEPAFKFLENQIIVHDLRILVLDTLAALFGADENKPDLMTGILTRLASIAGRLKVAILILHHNRKEPATVRKMNDRIRPMTPQEMMDAIRGTTGIVGSARRTLHILSMTEAEAVLCGVAEKDRWRYFYVTGGKTNYLPRAEFRDWYRLESVGLENGIPGHPETEVPVAVPWNYTGGSTLDPESITVLSEIDRGTDGKTVDPRKPENAYPTAQNWEPLAKATGLSKTVAKRVTEDLIKSGHVRKVLGRGKANGATSSGLVVSPTGRELLDKLDKDAATGETTAPETPETMQQDVFGS